MSDVTEHTVEVPILLEPEDEREPTMEVPVLLEPDAERRASHRKFFTVQAKVTVPGVQTLNGHTIDLSTGGIGVTVPFALQPGQDCELDLELEACGTTCAFHIGARVCYCVPRGREQFRAGMQFTQLDEATSALIAAAMR